MFRAGSDPVQPVSLSSALKISLDNFYDLLKGHAGVAQNELLQLRLSADLLDISDDKLASKGGYKWFSYHNLLDRSDRQIESSPVSPDPNGAQVNATTLSSIYGLFLLTLRSFVVKKELSADDQKKVADINGLIDQDKTQYEKLAEDDRVNWVKHCKHTGGNVEDRNAYISWSGTWGNLREMKDALDNLKGQYFNLNTILDRKYPDPGDRAIIDAEFDYNNMTMKASYPNSYDYDYPDGDNFNISYLITLGMSGTGAFDWRYVINWQETLHTIKTAVAGSFDAKWDQETGSSSSISTDWSGSASGSYYFISARASASSHTQIQEDFSKTTGVELAAEAAFRINIRYPQWFHPELFKSKHIEENPQSFEEFFGTNGSLLYHPLGLVVVRGFSSKFTSSQDWSYDYDHNFSASSGGGFSVGPISFGASGSYSEHQHEHQIDQQHTSLTISDDKSTIRFVGYVLAKNETYLNAIDGMIKKNRTAP